MDIVYIAAMKFRKKNVRYGIPTFRALLSRKKLFWIISKQIAKGMKAMMVTNIHHPDDGGSTKLRNVGLLRLTTWRYLRRISSSDSPLWEHEISHFV